MRQTRRRRREMKITTQRDARARAVSALFRTHTHTHIQPNDNDNNNTQISTVPFRNGFSGWQCVGHMRVRACTSLREESCATLVGAERTCCCARVFCERA